MNVSSKVDGYILLTNSSVQIHTLSWSCQSNLHLRPAMKNINTPLDGAYIAEFGIDFSETKRVLYNQEMLLLLTQC